MNHKITISNACLWKAGCIILALLFSFNVSIGAALAKSCDGEVDCLSCAEAAHPRLPGMDMTTAPQGCQPLEQKDACSFEISSGLDKLHGIIPAVRIDQNEAGDSVNAASVDNSTAQSAPKFSPQPYYFDTQPTTPIYLTIHSMLC
jgi:hypothetical protein